MINHYSILGLGKWGWAIFIIAVSFIFQCTEKVPLPAGFGEIVSEYNEGIMLAAVPNAGKGRYRVTVQNNPAGGTQPFWLAMFEQTVKEYYGYKVVEKNKIGDSGGEILSVSDSNSVQFNYLISFLIDGDYIYIHEYGAIKDKVENELSAVRKAIADYH